MRWTYVSDRQKKPDRTFAIEQKRYTPSQHEPGIDRKLYSQAQKQVRRVRSQLVSRKYNTFKIYCSEMAPSSHLKSLA